MAYTFNPALGGKGRQNSVRMKTPRSARVTQSNLTPKT